MDKYRNKYRSASVRLQHWDYGKNGAYFITICTKDRLHYFGDVADGSMQLNEMGKLVEQYWLAITDHFPFIELGNFVVMPNHLHGILVIDKDDNDNPNDDIVGAQLIAPLRTIQTGGVTGDKNPMFHQNISRIIRWYKGRCTFEIRKTLANFAWQPRFYDHIIRNSRSFNTIQNYIINNPKNWGKDKFYD